MATLVLPAFSNAVPIYDVKIEKIYAQSHINSSAHLIRIDKQLPSECNGNRLYIDLGDKELFSYALAKHISGQNVDIIYNTTAEPKVAGGHVSNLTCWAYSIF